MDVAAGTAYVAMGGDADDEGKAAMGSSNNDVDDGDDSVPLRGMQSMSLQPGEEGGEMETSNSATIQSSIFNVSNTILGSGTLAMPFACRECGIVPFLAMLVAFAYAADLAVRLLVISVENVVGLDELQYAALAKRTIGRKGELAAEWAVIVQQCGACVAYIVIIADVLQPIASLGATSATSIFCSRAVWQAVAAVGIIFPLCMLRRLDSLRHTSLAALGCIIGFVFAVTVNGMRAVGTPALRDEWSVPTNASANACSDSDTALSAAPGSTVKLFFDSAGVISALPIVCFAFLCHMNIFPVYEELLDRGGGAKRRDMFRVGTRSMQICAVVYGLSGVFGYLIFLETTESDLLKNFQVSGTSVSGLMDTLRVGFGFALIFSFPVVVWEARHGLELQIFGHGKAFSLRRHFLLNVGIVGGSLFTGMAVPTVLVPLGLVGSTCSPLIVFILPAMIFLSMKEQGQLDHDKALDAATIEALARKAKAALWSGIVLIPLCSVLWVIEQS